LSFIYKKVGGNKTSLQFIHDFNKMCFDTLDLSFRGMKGRFDPFLDIVLEVNEFLLPDVHRRSQDPMGPGRGNQGRK
jgi:hypothetical protein